MLYNEPYNTDLMDLILVEKVFYKRPPLGIELTTGRNPFTFLCRKCPSWNSNSTPLVILLIL